ncbi:hypothetical protein CBP51_05270 [Cellvibrio mixtus]|uniref:Uncharacterized protein n=2 Tax=Cellvibrionaceae TaxID=1706371 RepID=A0A266QAR8_9GAMM|nr:hypothetical protein B0D95_09785 [Cellvibrio sp. PSBB023]OZY86439.1 hypothetical protein CBP51_05270 [Cellvibrio mixtus]
MKYTLAVVISILAICALCFISVSVAIHFSPPLQPMFDQERLGQLGDFLGGTLNPIFGFATVCLLLWSVFIQRKELSLTRAELKRSAAALTDQVKLATDEYNRKQLDAYLQLLEQSYERLISEKVINIPNNLIEGDGIESQKSIKELIDYLTNSKNETAFSITELITNEKKLKLISITHEIYNTLEELVSISRSNAIRSYLTFKKLKYDSDLSFLRI